METLITHLQEYWVYYLLAAAVLLPPIIIFRRWSVPLIQYAAELVCYAALLHAFMAVVVFVAAWFKDQSTMKRAHGLEGQDFNPGWQVPIPRFWEFDEYKPHALLYVEAALLLVIVVLMWKYRPLNVQRPKKKPAPPPKSAAAANPWKKKLPPGGRK